ncbi:MAG: ATP-binding cassette domain-containing protein [Tissierellia bacterium]|nr:ATP-binding cassette domain-containing protein [Tissierellia bacterium]
MGLTVDIKKKFKGFTLDVSFSTKGGYLGILGPSGSGKSMTLKCIAGVETPDEGRIVLNGKVLFDSENKINLKPQERNIGYLFQNYALFPHMTVEENIGLGLRYPKGATFSARAKKEKEERVRGMIKLFCLQGLEDKYPNQLSGGQQQRVALARAIIYKPHILMLDEPFSALDAHLKDNLQLELVKLLKHYEGEVLMVSHSRDEIFRFCENLVVMDQGRSILFGKTKDIFRQPSLYKAAKIVGYKNISRCKILSSHLVRALDWGLDLKVGKPVPSNTKYIGIHAEELQLLEPPYEDWSLKELSKKDNIIKSRVEKIIEGEKEYHIYLKNDEIKNDPTKSVLLCKVRKDLWERKGDRVNMYFKIPQEAIIFLE